MDSGNFKNNDILDNIIKASANSSLQVTEDIYDKFDNKLLAKGYKISPEIREKLFDKVLKKPIEACISSDKLLTSEEIFDATVAVIKRSPILSLISPDVEGEAKALAQLEIEPLAAMLLTVLKDSESNKFNHALLVTLLARSIAANLNLQHRDIANLSIAGLLHDVGELYATVPESGSLTKADWHKEMTHPVLGSSVVRLYMKYPIEVSTAILEHHERCDKTGYPQKRSANDCSIIGQVLMLAEAISGILKPGVEVQNVVVALKMSSGVYPDKPLAVLNKMLKSLAYVRSEVDRSDAIDHLQSQIKTLNEVLLKIEDILTESDTHKLVVESLEHLRFRIEKLKQSIFASGMQYYFEDDSWKNSEDGQVVMLELEIVVNEIGWQVQDILRDTMLRLIKFSHELPPRFSEINNQLIDLNNQVNASSQS